MKKMGIVIVLLLMSVWGGSAALAQGIAWLDHAAPYDFLFGNHIDTHQQAKLMPDGELNGALYIEFTGEHTADGYPIAKHTDCNGELADCTVGWTFRGVPGEATFAYHVQGDHPVWLVAARAEIPQPGAFSHFHWLGSPAMAGGLVENTAHAGYFLELTAKDVFVFMLGNEQILVRPGLDMATHVNIVAVLPPGGGGGSNTPH